MTSDLEQRPDSDETVRKLAAAYTDASVAHSVIIDLVDAGLNEADVTVRHPWPVSKAARPGDRGRFFDHPARMAVFGGLALGGIASMSAWLWANPGQWLVYGLLGMTVGVITGSLAGALTATSPPHWHDRLLGDPLGAVTVEVTTTDPDSADVARLVMAGHDPALVQAETEPGPRPPAERVLWEHEEGLSPLQELGSWLEARAQRPPPEPARRRGRHLQT
jgi:hypothetical protein